MQRIAIAWISIVVVWFAGCAQPGSLQRRMAANQSLPSSRSFATPADDRTPEQRMAAGRPGSPEYEATLRMMAGGRMPPNRAQGSASPAAPPASANPAVSAADSMGNLAQGNAVQGSAAQGSFAQNSPPPGSFPQGNLANLAGAQTMQPPVGTAAIPNGVPVVPSSEARSTPPGPNSLQLTDQPVPMPGQNVRADGTIGLPHFRLTELDADKKRELGLVDQTGSSSPAQRIVNDEIVLPGETSPSDYPAPPQPEVSPAGVSNAGLTAPQSSARSGLPVAQPIPNSGASSASVQPAGAQLPRSGNPVPPTTASSPVASSGSSSTAGTMPGSAVMQVRVVDDSAGSAGVIPSAAGSGSSRKAHDPSAIAVAAKTAAPTNPPSATRPPVGPVANPVSAASKPTATTGGPALKNPAITLPGIEGKLAESLRSKTPAASSAGGAADSGKPAAAAPPEAAGASTSSKTIRVDPGLRMPGSAQPKAPASLPAAQAPAGQMPANTADRQGIPMLKASPKFQSPAGSTPAASGSGFQSPPPAAAAPAADRIPTNSGEKNSVGKASFELPATSPSGGPAGFATFVGGLPVFHPAAANSTASAPAKTGERAQDRNSASFKTGNPAASAANRQPASNPAAGVAASVARTQTLATGTVALTTEIKGFGQFSPLDTSSLRSGQTVLVYCELIDYRSLESRDANGSLFTTQLESSLSVLDASGKTVQQERYPVLTDTSRSPRHDFFMYVPLTLRNLTAGDYTVQLQIRDLNANSSTVSAPVAFRVR